MGHPAVRQLSITPLVQGAPVRTWLSPAKAQPKLRLLHLPATPEGGHSNHAQQAPLTLTHNHMCKQVQEAAPGTVNKQSCTCGSRVGSVDTRRMAASSCFWFMRKMSSQPGLQSNGEHSKLWQVRANKQRPLLVHAGDVLPAGPAKAGSQGPTHE